MQSESGLLLKENVKDRSIERRAGIDQIVNQRHLSRQR
jgi:hypothetical protein